MATEVHALIHAFDVSYDVRGTLQYLLQRVIKFKAYIDCCILFNVVANDKSAVECRIQIGIFALKVRHRRKDLSQMRRSSKSSESNRKGPSK